MNSYVILGLLLQVACIWIFWQRFRWEIFQYTGALFLLMVFVYHGLLVEVLNMIFSGRNPYRELVYEESIGNIVLLFSVGIFLFSIFYLFVFNTPLYKFKFKQSSILEAKNILNRSLPLLIGSTVAAFLISFYFKLSSDFNEINVSSEYWIYGLAIYLLPHLLIFSVLALILSYKKINIEILLPLFILINITTGRRSSILFPIIIVFIIIFSFGNVISKRWIAIIFSLAGVMLLLISIGRGFIGRDEISRMAPGERIVSFATGAIAEQNDSIEYILDDFVYRFDANASNALVLESIYDGYEPAGIIPILIDLRLQVPRFFNKDKLDTDLLFRDSESFVFAYFGHDPTMDHNQGWLGYLLACFGVEGFLIAMALLGLLLSRLDRWFVNTASILCIPFYYIVVYSIIYYEGILRVFLGSIRIVIFVVISMLIYSLFVKMLFLGNIKAKNVT